MDVSRLDAAGVGRSWSYWANIPDIVVWVDAQGSQITATEDGYLVEGPYVECSAQALLPAYQLRKAEVALPRHARHYFADQGVIDDLPLIEAWRYR